MADFNVATSNWRKICSVAITVFILMAINFLFYLAAMSVSDKDWTGECEQTETSEEK